MRLWKDGHFQGQNISPKKRAGPGGFGLNFKTEKLTPKNSGLVKQLPAKSIEGKFNPYIMKNTYEQRGGNSSSYLFSCRYISSNIRGFFSYIYLASRDNQRD